MRAQAGDHSIDVLVEDAGRVGHRLAKAELHVLPGEGRGRAAEAGDPGLISPFIECPATESHRAGDRRVTIGPRSRLSAVALLGFGLFASAGVSIARPKRRRVGLIFLPAKLAIASFAIRIMLAGKNAPQLIW